MTVRPFSTYPEDHAKMLALARLCDLSDDANAVELGDLVRAILEDEAVREDDPTPEGYVLVPAEMSDGMMSAWQGAFHRQTQARHKARFKPGTPPEACEKAAWKAALRVARQQRAETGKVQPVANRG